MSATPPQTPLAAEPSRQAPAMEPNPAQASSTATATLAPSDSSRTPELPVHHKCLADSASDHGEDAEEVEDPEYEEDDGFCSDDPSDIVAEIRAEEWTNYLRRQRLDDEKPACEPDSGTTITATPPTPTEAVLPVFRSRRSSSSETLSSSTTTSLPSSSTSPEPVRRMRRRTDLTD